MATPVTVSGGAPPLARPAESTKSVFAGTSLACLSGTRLRPSLTRPESYTTAGSMFTAVVPAILA